ncbi:MAG: YceD family protein [Alcanivorax sp.]|uniref:Large ribosomal RNA subunit accumulation protein YceD n=1 Tax=Alloalcanivorax marinus TaxID=1177169 RepID=A0A9Q3UN78_9GAMM|nr:YceD family protein [Alloalcanivorax marinus]MBM7333815.1 DUF177 domain-containing protein [Alloalcanivorax marinus]MCC4309305.1 YceD family protein [Alloalcanivorax marinus]MCH2559418.1 YceD family protein [Alcanivorax sp.]MCU5787831.1 hypothetical protein [Alloalcanivorax marinus]
MFSGQLPPYLEPRKFADQERVIEGEARVGDLPRLREYRDSQDQPVRVSLAFGRDEDGRGRVQGRVEATLILVCQRCLEPVHHPVVADVDLVLVWSEDQAKALPADLDPLLVTEERLSLAELLEEELLLALPLVALHDECPRPASTGSEPEPEGDPDDTQTNPDNPFAVLARLKGRRK